MRVFGLSRAAFGLWLMLAPRRPGEMWYGDSNPAASTTALLRSVGGRDVGIGLGLASNPTPDSLWLKVGILADVVDAAAALLASRRVPRKNAGIGFGGAAAYAVIGGVVMLSGEKRRR